MGTKTEQELRKQSRMFANATTALILILCFGIAVCFSTALVAPAGDVHELTLLHALYWFPSLFYLWVLVAIRRTFIDIAAGAMFGASIERGLRHLGWCMVAGGIAGTVLGPWVRSGPLPAGMVDGRTQIFGIDDADLVLALIGLAVLLLARLLNLAGRTQERSDALEAELKGFI
jgi:hypothetical protein